jgi:hypothetical protein
VISYGNFLEGAYTKMGVSFRGKKNRGLVGYSLHSLKNEYASKYKVLHNKQKYLQ